jgi:hypothetical protein
MKILVYLFGKKSLNLKKLNVLTLFLDRLLVSLLLPEMHEMRYDHGKRVGKEMVKDCLKVFFQHLHARTEKTKGNTAMCSS